MQVVVPGILRDEVLTQLHEGAVGGGENLGVDKTLARVKELFYWPGYTSNSNIGDWCSRCGVCAARKTLTPKARAPLSIVTGYPLQLVTMDIVSPFLESTAGNNCVGHCRLFHPLGGTVPHPQPGGCHRGDETSQFFCCFSPPERLHSDQGRNFKLAVVPEGESLNTGLEWTGLEYWNDL